MRKKKEKSHDGLRLAIKAVSLALAELAGLLFVYAASAIVC
jgi:hypothetical protein